MTGDDAKQGGEVPRWVVLWEQAITGLLILALLGCIGLLLATPTIAASMFYGFLPESWRSTVTFIEFVGLTYAFWGVVVSLIGIDRRARTLRKKAGQDEGGV